MGCDIEEEKPARTDLFRGGQILNPWTNDNWWGSEKHRKLSGFQWLLVKSLQLQILIATSLEQHKGGDPLPLPLPTLTAAAQPQWPSG